MTPRFQSLVEELRSVSNRFDDDGNARKRHLLGLLCQARLPLTGALAGYASVLMFLCAHPPEPGVGRLADAELERIASFLRQTRWRQKARLENSGLPYTRTLSTFSHDLLGWMTRSRHFRLQLDAFWNPTVSLGAALQFTLPALEREVAAAGLGDRKLLEALVPARADRLRFLLAEFDRLNDQPSLKDYLFEGLHLYLRVTPLDRSFSKAFNRLQPREVFHHRDLLRNFDQRELLDRRLPKPAVLSGPQAEGIVTVARHALLLLQRETDPTTYVDVASLRFYELERGISIALYGMTAARQLPLESYVGYTLFKNGYPAAYGGSWVFGRRALFGINVFEWFRGGESGYVMCQLLRVYRQVFRVEYFEVEPYQYGQGNPEGIRSGAFWFYYRHGFRPLEPDLAALAAAEHDRIMAQKAYRCPPEVLRRLARGNVALRLGNDVPPRLADVRERVTALIQARYRGNRLAAEADCRRKFIARAGGVGRLNADQDRVLSEVSLWAEAMDIGSARPRSLLRQMIRVKPVDLYGYQDLLLKLLR